ncbi:MAG: nicotinamide-nucleotide amidase [Saprospiraceae bacterium]|jgi:nicotinamide-nucleotide amidase
MNAAIVSIGDELLIGQTVNTNAGYIGEKLTLIGVDVQAVYTISDKEDDIINTLTLCQNKYQLVVLTGGLGPTKDDITKTTLAKYFGVELVLNEAVLENVMSFFASYKKEVQPVNHLQAQIPEGCKVLMNKAGTAPGMWMEKEETIFVSLPGVPREMRYLTSKELVPILQNEFELPSIYSHNILTQGIGESYIAEQISHIEDSLPQGISLAYLPSRGMVKLRVTGRGSHETRVIAAVNQQVELIKNRISEHVFGDNYDEIAKVVGELLLNNGATLSVAESLTGGALGKEITSVSGASSYFIGGLVSYDVEVKINELKVGPLVIAEHDVVSEKVAIQMAIGALDKFGSTYAIATTGLAGPNGGTKEIPVGTVYIAVVSEKTVVCKKFNFGGDRSGVVRRTVLAALNMLRKELGGRE